MLDKSACLQKLLSSKSRKPITSDGPCGRRVGLSRITANVDFIRAFCLENECKEHLKFRIDLERLLESVTYFYTIADEYFFANLTENGIITYVRIATTYTDLVVKQIRTQNRIDPDFLQLFKLCTILLDALPELYEDLKSEHEENARNAQVSNCKLHLRKKSALQNPYLYWLLSEENNEAFVTKFSTPLGFWLPNDVRRGLKVMVLGLATAKNLPWSLSSLFSSKSYATYILDMCKTINLDYPFNFWNLPENPLFVKVMNYFFNFWIPVQGKTLHLPRQKRFRLDYRGNILDFDRMTQQEKNAYMSDQVEQERQRSPGMRHRNHSTIRCRYSQITSKEKILESRERIRKRTVLKPKVLRYQTARKYPETKHSNEINNNEINNNEINNYFRVEDQDEDFHPNPDGKLVLYIHGGAFFCHGAQSSEMFLHKILNQLGGINILAIDYSLTVPYPVPLQEILDVYLWLFSGKPEVKRMLGFHPKKIILSGDSSGAYLALCLVIVLNELNNMLRSQANGCVADPIPLPTSMVTIYGVLSISKLFPSLMFCGLDPFLDAHLLLTVLTKYGANAWCNGDFKRIEKSERFQRIVAKNKDQPVGENGHKTAKDDDSTPWFRCDYSTYMNRAEYIASFFDHPFIEPMLYEDRYDQLKNIDLYCMVGNNDCMLDCSIDMARMWKGKTCVDVFEDATHGFLHFAFFSAEGAGATEVAIERFQEACGLL